MKLQPLGKWLWIAFDTEAPLVEAIGLDGRRNTGTVLCVGSAGSVLEGDRILFEAGRVCEHTVDGETLALLHEDHVVAIVKEEAL